MEPIVRSIALMITVLFLSFPAHAYLDPVTGSLVIQGLIALVAAIVAGVKSVRLWILSAFASLIGRREK